MATVVLRLQLGEDAPEDFAMHAMMKARENDPEVSDAEPVTVVSVSPVLGERGWVDVAFQIGEPPDFAIVEMQDGTKIGDGKSLATLPVEAPKASRKTPTRTAKKR